VQVQKLHIPPLLLKMIEDIIILVAGRTQKI
jgi:hypothetical protein